MITKRIPNGRPPIEKGRKAMDEFAKSISKKSNEELFELLKYFISERESIRKLKESEQPKPWTTDSVLANSKFSNIYRVDDKVSRLIYKKVDKLSGPLLVYNLILSRLINRCDILDNILPANPNNPPKELLNGSAVIMNPGAYQVSPGMAKLDKYETNRETIIYYVPKIYEKVFEAITNTTDIEKAVENGNKAFGGHIKFVMLQIVLDYHHLTKHFDEQSNVPIGQGAKALCEKLGGLEAIANKLEMSKYDTEHTLCEFRKYLSRQSKIPPNAKYRPNHLGIQERIR